MRIVLLSMTLALAACNKDKSSDGGGDVSGDGGSAGDGGGSSDGGSSDGGSSDGGASDGGASDGGAGDGGSTDGGASDGGSGDGGFSDGGSSDGGSSDGGSSDGGSGDGGSSDGGSSDGGSSSEDADGDGFTSDVDCDDTDAAIHPDATEVCNDVDDDCDGLVDDDDDSVVATDGGRVYYTDADGDGYGLKGTGAYSCDMPEGTARNFKDCDDTDADVNPGATEVCNDIDDDCDDLIDEEDDDLDTSTATAWYTDADGDGYGLAGTGAYYCDTPEGASRNYKDCDDDDAAVNPAADEECNGYDDDCDGNADDSDVCPCDVEYQDGDARPYMFCEDASAWSDAQTTCDDYGYHLLTIDDADEDDWVDLTADSYSTAKWWIGYNDIDEEDSWVWADGSTSTYTNWHSGEPNDSGGNEDCAQLNRYADGTWNDEPCTSSFRFVCEYE